MNWKEKAKEVGDWLRRKESEQAIEEKTRKDEAERLLKEEEQTIAKFGPLIKKVCEEFACEIGGKLVHYSPSKFEIVDPHCPLRPGEKIPEKELFEGGYIAVQIISTFVPVGYILVDTMFCTDSLFAKCKHKRTHETLAGYCCYTTGNEYSGFFQAAYRIPLHDLNEDRLATVLEEFCKDAMNPKATVHTYGSP